MIVLLPPSEGKTAPKSGQQLDLARLSNPTLNPAREQVLGALIRLCRRTPRKALSTLGLSVNQRLEVTANAELRTAPAAPAWLVYSGVLFAALDYASMSTATQKRAASRLLITSSLFGVLTPNDPIPAYRISGVTCLPKRQRVDAFWRKHLDPAMAESIGDRLVIDMRSGTYVKFWPIPATLSERALTVKIWQFGVDGNRIAVSHHNKATKGELARTLASACDTPRTRDDVVDLLRDQNWDVRLSADPQLPHDRLDVTIN